MPPTPPPVEWAPPVALDLPAVEGNAELDPRAPGVWLGREAIGLTHRDPATGRRISQVVPTSRPDDPFSESQRDALREALRAMPTTPLSTVNLFVDKGVPYRRVFEVRVALDMAGHREHRFAVEHPEHSAVVLAERPGEERVYGPLHLGVMILEAGVHIIAPADDLGPALGCPDGGGRGCLVGAGPSDVTRAAKAVKARFPTAYSIEVVGGRRTPWEAVLGVMAAMRRDGSSALFPSALLAMPHGVD